MSRIQRPAPARCVRLGPISVTPYLKMETDGRKMRFGDWFGFLVAARPTSSQLLHGVVVVVGWSDVSECRCGLKPRERIRDGVAGMAVWSEEDKEGHSMRHFLGPLGFFGAGGSRAATIACKERRHISFTVQIYPLESSRRHWVNPLSLRVRIFPPQEGVDSLPRREFTPG